MSDVYTITVKAAGPLIVSGPVRVVDPQGVAWEVDEGSSVGLCRCGQSGRKPAFVADRNDRAEPDSAQLSGKALARRSRQAGEFR